jgi:hypothetical protein
MYTWQHRIWVYIVYAHSVYSTLHIIATILGVRDYRRSFDGWIWFIEHSYTPLGTTSNYRVTAYLHTSQITTAPTTPFSQPSVSLRTVPLQRHLSVEILQLPSLTSLLSGEYSANELSQSAWGRRYYSLRADPTENTASNSSSIVVMGGYLAIARILLTCLSAVTKQRMFLLEIVA